MLIEFKLFIYHKLKNYFLLFKFLTLNWLNSCQVTLLMAYVFLLL